MQEPNTQKHSVDFTSLYFVEGIKFLLFDTVKDAIFFWIWWYTDGITRAAGYCRRLVFFVFRILPLKLFIKNITRPMFGDYSFTGRLIGFFLRLFQLIFSTLFALLAMIVIAFLFLVWIFLPPVAVGFLIIALGWVQ